jgi:hypothetical protein
VKDHGRIGENNLFFGPYLGLEPGDYTIRINGNLEGRLRLRLTQKFASECLLETIVKSFEDPIRLRLTGPAEKFEIIGDRVDDTGSMTLRAIEIVRETAEQTEEVGEVEKILQSPSHEPKFLREPVLAAEDRPAKRGGGFIWDSMGRALSLPLTMPAAELIVRDAFGTGSSSRARGIQLSTPRGAERLTQVEVHEGSSPRTSAGRGRQDV